MAQGARFLSILPQAFQGRLSTWLRFGYQHVGLVEVGSALAVDCVKTSWRSG